jgi:LuxR family maltose regulon positive regulatory protein
MPRPRLVERLNVGLHRKLTLISAAAGFGKTTLLSDWVRHTERPVAWLSLDRGDNDPGRFWRYVIAALQTVDTAIGRTAQAALLSPQQPPLNTLVTALINDVVAFPAPLILVLDDYHVIEAEPIHNSLNFLLDHLPPQLHLVITTRADPPLSLSRRRGRSELTEIRMADLCFTTKEAVEFLNTCMGLDLSAEDITRLEDRTEGWIVGLQMAALSLQGRADKHDFVTAFAGDDCYVGDYLVEEVLRHQPPHNKTFLLQTSILERLCGSSCDAVTEGRRERGEESQAILEYLERANLFIVPLDNRRHWYRYHHLFADLLHRHLRQSVGAQALALLHLRASTWYEREGFIAEAVSHALAAPDLEHATALIERHAPDIASRGEIVLARSWLEALPEDMVRSSPYLCLLRSGFEESTELSEQWFQDAERAWAAQSSHLDEQEMSDRVAQTRFSGWVASARASLSFRRGDSIPEVIEFSRQALDYIPEDNLLYNLRARSNLFLILGYSYWRLGNENAANQAFAEARRIGEAVEHFSTSIWATCNQARIAYDRGRLRQAAAICQAVLRSIVEPSEQVGRPLPVAGGLYIVLGSILLEWNDLEGASRALTKGLEMIQLTRETSIQKDGYITLARLKQAQGDVAGAFDLIEQVEQLRIEADSEAAALKMRFWLSQAERDPRYLDVAAQFAEERQFRLDHKERRSVEQLALAHLLIAQRRARQNALSATSAHGQPQPDLQPLLRFLDRQLQVAEEQDQTWWMANVLILQAMALQVQGDTDQAIFALQRALELAEPEGFARIFVDKGAPMARLLYQAAACGIAPDYAGKLLTAFPDAVPTDQSKVQRPRAEMVEPLTRRELEVLRLVAAGLSNREIAQRLVISPGTVKVHISNIYDKLGVRKRTQAVAKARMLGVL